MKFFAAIARPTIRNECELVRYVSLVTAFALAFALAVDVVNQLAFFVDWARCLWSWSVTTAVCLIVATPIAYSIGRTHLELFRAKELADELGRTNSLTGLSNRRALIEDAESSLAEVLALTIFDIDRFKSVNDAYGHLVGDAALRAVGRMMQEELGAVGLVARVGGEEFAAADVARLARGSGRPPARVPRSPARDADPDRRRHLAGDGLGGRRIARERRRLRPPLRARRSRALRGQGGRPQPVPLSAVARTARQSVLAALRAGLARHDAAQRLTFAAHGSGKSGRASGRSVA